MPEPTNKRKEKDEDVVRAEWEADERLRLRGGEVVGIRGETPPDLANYVIACEGDRIPEQAQVKFSLGDVCTVDVSLPASEVEHLTQLRDRWADVDEIRLDLPDGSHCTWPTNYACEKPPAAQDYPDEHGLCPLCGR